jgi:capsular polysaccharide biosynthesis protein
MAEPNSISLDDRSLLSVIGRWWYLLLLCPIVAGLAGYAVVHRLPSVYEASETITVQPITGASGVPDMLTAQALADTYAVQIDASPVLTVAAASVGLSTSPAELGAMVTARRVTNTALVNVTVQADDPELAAQFADAIAQTFIAQTSQGDVKRYTTTQNNLVDIVTTLQSQQSLLNQQIDGLRAEPQSPERDAQINQLTDRVTQTQASQSVATHSLQDLQLAAARSDSSLTVSDPAIAPTAPVRPNRSLSVLMAVLAGVFAGVGMAWIAEQIRRTRSLPLLIHRGAPAGMPLSDSTTPTPTQRVAP